MSNNISIKGDYKQSMYMKGNKVICVITVHRSSQTSYYYLTVFYEIEKTDSVSTSQIEILCRLAIHLSQVTTKDDLCTFVGNLYEIKV